MKSNGLALKIHVSQQSAEKLAKTRTFEVNYRGTINLKNRGDMQEFASYFLIRQKKKYKALGYTIFVPICDA